MTPTPPVVGETTVARLTLRDEARRPIDGAKLRIEGHMSHPGMAPFIVTPEEEGDGLYEAHLEFTMAGDWILLVTGELPGQRRLSHRIEVTNVQPK